MIHEIRIPQMGLTSAQVMVMKWSVQDEEEVQEGDVLVTIETDKVSFEISAPGSGFVKILQPKGSIVSVGHVIGLIATTRKEYKKIPPASIVAPQPEFSCCVRCEDTHPGDLWMRVTVRILVYDEFDLGFGVPVVHPLDIAFQAFLIRPVASDQQLSVVVQVCDERFHGLVKPGELPVREGARQGLEHGDPSRIRLP